MITPAIGIHVRLRHSNIVTMTCESAECNRDYSNPWNNCMNVYKIYNMNLMSNTAVSYQMGAGRFELWLLVNCYRVPTADKAPQLETSCTHLIRSCSIAHQIHVVSTNAAMSLYRIVYIHSTCIMHNAHV